jgi:HEAT repeat protein
VAPRLAIASLLLVTIVAPAAAQRPAAPAPPPATDASMAANIATLASFDDAARTRAARLLRRAPERDVVPALTAAVRNPAADEYVRYRALVILTSFGGSGLRPLVEAMLRDSNDRVRETAYKWLEDHPDPATIPSLLSALQTEQAEFVRPALVGALAALGADPDVQRALQAQVGQGLDLFRSAVIDALGRHHADYAAAAIAPIAQEDGPLQNDAILALGRIGGSSAREALASLTSVRGEAAETLHAARCLADEGTCGAEEQALEADAAASGARAAVTQAAVLGLSNVAQGGRAEAAAALLRLSSTPALHNAVAVALGTFAVRQPDRMLAWLQSLAEADRLRVETLLKDGFDSLEEDYGKEQFFAATRAAYWKAPEGSPMRALAAALIERLEF